jgi:hypothetical protein
MGSSLSPWVEATLLHEMCHAAAWLVDHCAKPPHGTVFKAGRCRFTL